MDRRLAYKERAKDVRSRLSSSSQRAIDLNSETGSSAWLRGWVKPGAGTGAGAGAGDA